MSKLIVTLIFAAAIGYVGFQTYQAGASILQQHHAKLANVK